MGAVLSQEDFQLLNLLEQKTGAQAVDVLRTETALVFIVAEGNAGKAIGKQRANLVRLGRETGKSVDVVENSDDLETFAKNAFKPALLRQVEIKEENGIKKIFIKTDAQQRGLAIGRNGEKIKRARLLLARRFDVADVKLV